jgi:hypothetical protein
MGVRDRDYMRPRGATRGDSYDPPLLPRWVFPVGFVIIGLGLWAVFSQERQLAPSEYEADWQMRKETVPAGTFEVKSGQLAAADPDLTLDAMQAGKLSLLLPAADGEWKAHTRRLRMDLPDGSDHRETPGHLLELAALHSSVTDVSTLKWTPAGEIEVHGSSAGIFDAATFRQDALITSAFTWTHPPRDAAQMWYSACLEKCRGLEEAGTMPGGAVARAGRGRLKVLAATQPDGKAIAVSITLSDIDEEEFYYGED